MNSEQRSHYERCLANGCQPGLAEMLALQSPPMSNTDREFLEGRTFLDGKVYCSGLARYPDDPEAWVSGRGDVQRVCEQRGWGCEGAVNVKLTNVAQPSGGGIARSLVDAEVEQILASTPEAASVDVEDLREQVVAKRAPHWAPREVE